MGERRVMVVINPPEPLRCGGCRWQRYIGPIFRRENFCNLHFEVDPLTDVRPTACIAAEEQAARAAEWWALAFGAAGDRERDRVADALAAVLGPEPVEL